MKVLVTGASGYIGRHVINELINEGQEVIACDFIDNINNSKVKFINNNLFDKNISIYQISGEPDVCIHLAWRDGFNHNASSHMEDLSKHIEFCNNMMGNGLKKLVIMGTMHEIGFYEGEVNNNTPCNPMSQYGIAKNALRQSLMNSSKEYKTKLIWLRGFYIMGDYKNGSNIFSKLARAEENGEKLFPFTSGKNKYDFIDVDDLAKMIVKASLQDKYDGIINVCSGKSVSLKEKVENFIKENKFKIKLDYGKFPDRPYDSKEIYGNTEIIDKIMKL